ncbi:MAG: hypothetical protein ACOYB8_01790 [Eubacteriaceae bacterium]|jgi:hypothetical protein
MGYGTKKEEADGFVPLFNTTSTGQEDQQISAGASRPDTENAGEDEHLSDAMKEKLARIEERERSIAVILTKLEKSYAQLAKREAALNKKEETLNREYLKILELESLYKGIDKLSDALNSVLPSLTTEEINLREAEAKLKEEK